VAAPGAPLDVLPRLAAIVGADGELAGYTLLADWRLPAASPPKDRDFALGLGPLLVTPGALAPDPLEVVVRVEGEERGRGRLDGLDWPAARDLAAAGTVLRPGDVLAGPAAVRVQGVERGSSVDVVVEGIGTLSAVTD
jgi:2-keto-4-pentenoate hydratase/2-oxohepta-3-ene-1,7-dioic acid hydratase in catechol pathway